MYSHDEIAIHSPYHLLPTSRESRVESRESPSPGVEQCCAANNITEHNGQTVLLQLLERAGTDEERERIELRQTDCLIEPAEGFAGAYFGQAT